jgi:hypothetical protein
VKISLQNSYSWLKRIPRCTNRGLAALSRLADITLQLRNMLLLGSVNNAASGGSDSIGKFESLTECRRLARPRHHANLSDRLQFRRHHHQQRRPYCSTLRQQWSGNFPGKTVLLLITSRSNDSVVVQHLASQSPTIGIGSQTHRECGYMCCTVQSMRWHASATATAALVQHAVCTQSQCAQLPWQCPLRPSELLPGQLLAHRSTARCNAAQ